MMLCGCLLLFGRRRRWHDDFLFELKEQQRKETQEHKERKGGTGKDAIRGNITQRVALKGGKQNQILIGQNHKNAH